MKRKLLILASTFFLAGCGGGNGSKIEVGQTYTFSPTIAISATEEEKTNFFNMIPQMKEASTFDEGDPFYQVSDASSLGNFLVNQYKSVVVTTHYDSPKEFFGFKLGTSRYDIDGGLRSDGTFCDVYGEGTYYRNYSYQVTTQKAICTVENHFLKIVDSDISLQMTATISDPGSVEISKAVINVTIPVTK